MFGIDDMAVATVGSSLIGGLMGNDAQASANRSSARQAAAQMDFQERMSNTAHQREVADLRAAGLNPILSGTGGHGSARPSGAMGTVIPENALATSVASAYRTKLEAENLKKDTFLKDQSAWTARSLMHLYNMEWNSKQYDQDINRERLREAKADADVAESAAKGAKVEGEIDEGKYGAALRFLNRLNPLGQGASAWRNAIHR